MLINIPLVLAIIVLLSLVGNLYVYRKLKFAANKTTKGILSGAEDLTYRIDALTRQNQALFTMITEDLSSDPSKSDKLRKLCNVMIDDSHNPLEEAKGYQCLAKLHLADKNKGQLDRLKAIKNTSYALNLSHDPEYVRLSYVAILGESVDELISLFVAQSDDALQKLLSSLNVADSTEEIKLLEKIIQLADKDVKIRAKYRLSHIYQNGHSAAESTEIPIDYIKLLENRKYVFENVKTTSKNIVNIALTFDDGYAAHASTNIASLLVNADPETHYKFYIVDGVDVQISQENREKLSSLNYIKEYDINFITFPDEILGKIDEKYITARFPKIVLYRIFLSKILDISKIIYLDSDLVVLRDLWDVFNTETSFISATLDPLSFRHAKLPRNNKAMCKSSVFYINSGMMLLNLDAMRGRDLAAEIQDVIKNAKYPFNLPDQDMINFTYKDKINFISPKWNLNNLKDTGFAKHFVGTKPWVWPTSQDATETWKNAPQTVPEGHRRYWHYLDITPWTTKKDKLQAVISD
ncbi:MAG: hypothetical protein COA94_05725 [Rickettsiales bacterium]|nr:MAG: hypothetical protein COA94_05725 [Rickettsiales bacterium]